MELQRTREIKGSVEVPPSTELFFLTAILSTKCSEGMVIQALPETPELGQWQEILDPVLIFKREDSSLRLQPREDLAASSLRFESDRLPFRDFALFALLGQGVSVAFGSLSDERIAFWQEKARLMKCTLEVEKTDDAALVHFGTEEFSVPRHPVELEHIYALLGTAFGMGRKVSFQTEQAFLSPLRQGLPSLGWEFSVRQQGVQQEDDPLQRRMRFLAKKKKTEESISYQITAEFHQGPTEQKQVTLPGDTGLASLLIAAKALVQRGALVINNVSTESWASETLDFVRKMGCKPAIQETGTTTFGSIGMVQLQPFQLAGRKATFRQLAHSFEQIPAMLLIAAFSPGQSVFRGLEDLRRDLPVTFDQLTLILERTGTRHGEMPDGIVIDGSKEGDGFDLSENLWASMNGACAVCALKCRGTTTVADESIKRRWPHFEEMLKAIRDSGK